MTTRAAEALRRLEERGWSLAVAESLTGGALTSAFVEVPGASRTLRGGLVCYDTRLKHSLLGVDPELLARSGAVDPDVAAQMAWGVRRACETDGEAADAGVSTTGVAGPDPQDGKPVGLVYIGVRTPEGARVSEHRFDGDRAAIRRQAVDAALEELLRALS